MPLDIMMFRELGGGSPEEVKASNRKRYMKNADEIVDQIVDADTEWRQETGRGDVLRKEMRAKSKAIGEIMKKKKSKTFTDDDAAQVQRLKEEVKALKDEIAALEQRLNELSRQKESLLYQVGNIVHESVPVHDDEEHNEIVSEWGDIKPRTGKERHHHELLWMIGGYEPQKGSNVAGNRAYFLTGPGVLLNLALQNYGLAFLTRRSYQPVYPPFIMRKPMMARTAQLEDFDEQLYHVSSKSGTREEKEEDPHAGYLIATSEQPISCMHADEWLQPTQLPIRYAGVSTCFRKEAGKAGKDVWGIFRVHQFEKIEQFVYCTPEESWNFHEEMRETAEEFYRSLNIPYRVVNIVSGELNNAAAKKYDLEGYFPGFAEVEHQYKELVSCSNCLDYQARAMNTRLGFPTMGDREKRYVHMLNATLCATTRTICAILENYQTDDGVNVPEVLRPYLGGIDFFPFVRPPPENVAERKNEKKQQKAKRKAQKAAKQG